MTRPIEIWSGGQTGVDQAGWEAARVCGLVTGGWMPGGYLTEDGPRPDYAVTYNAREVRGDQGYPARTRLNVRDSDGLLLLCVLGAPTGPGTRLTERLGVERCSRGGYKTTRLGVDLGADPVPEERHRMLVAPLLRHVAGRGDADGPGRLMIAGVRETSCMGVGDWAREFLAGLLGETCPECRGGTWDRVDVHAIPCPVCDGRGLVPAADCYPEDSP